MCRQRGWVLVGRNLGAHRVTLQKAMGISEASLGRPTGPVSRGDIVISNSLSGLYFGAFVRCAATGLTRQQRVTSVCAREVHVNRDLILILFLLMAGGD